ncbi:hypothetical protein NO995_05295 [Aestuariibaculum sp. M13]|uniref:hypothetical protein n=1 Tax=Aestuariibaculum sp. M13 TaxID=2967132 RepID=UPI002159FD77|nr:hypothetical protein [Aestuariibaculum sp. M13]MCR8667087.1 hypothetical protein [Aestuariibaculum sp. M13]
MRIFKLYLFVFMYGVFGLSAQTKEETLEWLNDKLDQNTKIYPLGKFSISIEKDPDYGDIIVITKQLKILGVSTSYFSFLPNTIKDVRLTSKYRTSSEFTDIEFVSKGTTIYDVQTKELKKYVEILWDGSKDDLVRVRKGIIHLLDLLGNKIEQKELFTD